MRKKAFRNELLSEQLIQYSLFSPHSSVALLGKQETSSEMSELLGDTNLHSAAVFLGHSCLQCGKLAASNLLDIFTNYVIFRKFLRLAAKDGVQHMGLSFLLGKL